MKPHPNHPVFIVFEGLDGSGKSTCARKTADLLDAELLTTPSPAIRAFREEIIEELRDSQEARQLFYLSTVFAASEQIRGLLESGRSVVLDRYFLSTQAYAAFRGSSLELDPLGGDLVHADATVFLHAPLSVRLERMRQRGVSAADRETMIKEADSQLRHEHQLRTEMPVLGRFVSIDTTNINPDEVAHRVLTEAAGARRAQLDRRFRNQSQDP